MKDSAGVLSQCLTVLVANPHVTKYQKNDAMKTLQSSVPPYSNPDVRLLKRLLLLAAPRHLFMLHHTIKLHDARRGTL